MITEEKSFTVLIVARYSNVAAMFGFFAMALFRLPLYLNKSISFWKLLGCGKNGTFDITPDLNQWAMLVVINKPFDNSFTSANGMVKEYISKFIASYLQKCKAEVWILVMQPYEGHGTWDGKECFGQLPRNSGYEGITGTLTRATIRLTKLKAFWKNVKGAAHHLQDMPGFIASVGIGEVPWIKQATFSLWEDKASMKNFAYRMQQHSNVITKTRKENWYSEDMFVRFKPIASFGTLQGKNPLEGKL